MCWLVLMIHLNIKLRTKELDIRFECVEEIMRKKQQPKKKR